VERAHAGVPHHMHAGSSVSPTREPYRSLEPPLGYANVGFILDRNIPKLAQKKSTLFNMFTHMINDEARKMGKK